MQRVWDNSMNVKRKKLILINNSNPNKFITTEVSDLKNKEIEDFREDIINEIVENFEEYDSNFQLFSRLDLNNSKQNTTKLKLFEEIENKMIFYYDKMIKFLDDDNINDYHLLTNRYFLKKICNNIFNILAKEKKIYENPLNKPGKNLEDDNENTIKDEEIKYLDKNWKIKRKVLQLLINLLNNICSSGLIIKEIIDKEKSFILVNLLDSYDQQEKMLGKLIIYRIISASIKMREQFMKVIGNFLNDHLYGNIPCENERDKFGKKFFFLEELLDILKCLFCGLNLPIKVNYLVFLKENIIPIIKKDQAKFNWKDIKIFFLKLADKDINFLKILIVSLVRYWSVKFPERIINFIDLVDTILANYFDDELNVKKYKIPEKKGKKKIFEEKMHNYMNDFEKNSINFSKEIILEKINEPDILKDEIIRILDEKFDLNFYVKKIQLKILNSIKDTNFLIADKSMVIFKNEKIISQFMYSKFGNKLIDNLIFNFKFHWSQDIKMISNLVIIKIISSYPEILNDLSEENKKYIQMINNNIHEEREELWDIQFNLKAD